MYMPDRKVRFTHVSLSVRYNTVLAPFDVLTLMRILPRIGYVPVPEVIGPVPFGARINLDGIIGRKAELAIAVDSSTYTLGIQSPTPDNLCEEMSTLLTEVDKEFAINTSLTALFYEFLASGDTISGSDVLEAWERLFATTEVINDFSRAIGQKVSPYGVRLYPQGQEPNQPDWFEIQVLPSLHAPRKILSIQAIYRSHERQKVFTFVQEFTNLVDRIMEVVEP